jgi:hypothetical protein
VFQVIADDLARSLRVDTAAMFRFQTDGTVVLLSQYTTGPKPTGGVRPPLILDGTPRTPQWCCGMVAR